MILQKSKQYDFKQLLNELVALGYQRVEMVVDQGELAVRGGILDIFPAGHNVPVRLEFLDKELESLRTFMITTQRSITELKTITIPPVIEKHELVRSRDFVAAEDHLLPQINTNEHVVHENYGIALFKGLIHLEEDSVGGEYYLLQFAGSEQVYVPIEQSRLLHKYTAGDLDPKLSSLSEKTWNKTKQKVKAATKNIAFELFQLYRQRQQVKGFAFPEDTEWQLQMEELFPYQETTDQLAAINAVKQDMEQELPMDRLVCGDVGYGKTEIAIRAAFKAATAGKQVAVLAPTTILVDQHYHNFLKRFEKFGLIIRSLSRFHTQAENKRIVAQLKAGVVDIVIGTHRLLQKDIGFKNLGLLIVDEEQRFGVEHKEFIKKMFVGVDILTLSATPIPRTLYMSLSGVRDISVLQTAPQNRRPIQTICAEYTDETISKAITRELSRQGQVYLLNNDIRSLDKLKAKLLKLFPEARIGIGHGKMHKHELEQTILDFSEQKLDILLCTTIIENGIDIPNVNTIIVNNADHFGVSQLHQIRGRVGRADKQAYAYLLYKPEKVLTDEARARLHALKEFTALGAGYRIALRDLEIRGSGNILGPQQSGFVQSIGFTLYCKLLEESLAELKGETIEKEQVFTLPSGQENFIPQEYMEEEALRVSFYQRIMEVQSTAELHELEQEMRDRFGVIPKATQNLITNIRYQLQAKETPPVREKKTIVVRKPKTKRWK